MFKKTFYRKYPYHSSGKMLAITAVLVCMTWCVSFDSYSQSCLPDGITFTTQSQIDSFPINYPGCTEIGGSVEIRGGDISDLSGLSNINSIGGKLIFIFCHSLHSLEGLEELSTIDSMLVFQQNYFLSNLSGLGNLSSIGTGFVILGNSSLTSFSGLEELTSVGGTIWMEENYTLNSLTGLGNLTTIGGSLMILINSALNNLHGLEGLTNIGGELYISYNGIMSDLTGLENLESIGGGIRCWSNSSLIKLTALYGLNEVGGQLSIRSNDALSSLDGLDNISPASISELDISFNDLLSTCHVKSVCNYLASPNGTVEIYGNAVGCNGKEEVQDSCIANSVHINEQVFRDIVMFYPNPCKRALNISADGYIIDEISIYNKLGQRVIHEMKPANTIDVSWLPQGLYIVEVIWDEHRVREKLIVQ